LKSAESQKTNDSKFWWRKLSERNHLQDPGIEWNIILKWMLKIRGKIVDCVYLSQDMDKKQAAVNMFIKLRVLYNVGNFLTS
jgi:hypothetical protein